MKAITIGALALLSSSSFATLINFDDGSVVVGSTLSNQYSGVTFAGGQGGLTIPNAVATTQGFATTTDMTIVDSAGGDVGGLGTPPLVSGLLLHSFNGWLGEDGDPVMVMTFGSNVTDISMDFAGSANPASCGLFAYDAGGTMLSSITGTGTTGQFTLSLTGLTGANRVAVTFGDFSDWVGVDNINYTTQAVPEPASMTALGLGLVAVLRRRRKA